ncbi:MAG: hypothetical protein ACTSR8_03275 [Promethearchaeota archaeon]
MSENPIWRFKYLPKNLEEVCGREDTKQRLKEIIRIQNFPHLLFIGQRGIGKTTIARLFSKAFLRNFYDANFRLIYANEPLSDEERKSVKNDARISKNKIGSTAGETFNPMPFLEAKVKPFVELKVLGGAPFKILLVNNFEMLQNEQQGFRRLMEIYGNNCRMILIATKISKIIDPIVSRCQIFIISQVDYESFHDLIQTIRRKESIDLKEEIIKDIYTYSQGNISKAIDVLQLCSISSNVIDEELLYKIISNSQGQEMKELLEICLKGNFQEARKLSRIISSKFKYDSHLFFSNLLDSLQKLPLSKYSKIKLYNFIADADVRATNGRDDDIQISALISKICAYAKYI